MGLAYNQVGDEGAMHLAAAVGGGGTNLERLGLYPTESATKARFLSPMPRRSQDATFCHITDLGAGRGGEIP